MSEPSAPAPEARAFGAPVLLAVLVGGAVGTLLRVAVDTALPAAPGAFAVSTLVVNVGGSLVLGIAVAGLWARVPLWARAGLGAGVLGSFTTLSALSDALWLLTAAGSVGVALLTACAHVVLGLAAAVAGLSVGAAMARRHPRPRGDGGGA